MAQSELIHLAADASLIHANGSWRFPGSWQGFPPYGDPALYQHVAQVLERGGFDLAFFADTAGTQGDGEEIDAAISGGLGWPRHDPMPMAVAMALATTNLGVGVTMSTTYHHPFHVARLFASVDHVTRGRIAWNAVTSAYRNEAANFGYRRMPAHDERYARAQEHLEVVFKLWQGVSPDALVMDRHTGVYADPAGYPRLDHLGAYFDVAGPLPVLPSPQGRPVVVQAGASPAGLALAARYADYQFAAAGTVEGMMAHRTALDEALLAAGRKPRDVGILWSVRVDVVADEAEAEAREKAYAATQPPGSAVHHLTQLFSVDLSRFPEETPLGEVVEAVQGEQTNWGYLHDALRTAGPDTSLGEYAAWRVLHGAAEAVGTPEQVVDQLEEMHFAAGANGGFILTRQMAVPGDLERFVTDVVPELRRRGLVRPGYAGPYLRDNLLD